MIEDALSRPGHLRAVTAAAPEAYPISRSERLPELAWVKWYGSRWLFSKAHLTCTYEVQGMMLALFDIATLQSPIGTLPDDDEELAKLLRVDLIHWRSLRRQGDYGPLRGWVHVDCEGELRLAHAVVTEGLEDVLRRRDMREATRSAQAETKRIDRLRQSLAARKLAAAIAGDMMLLRRIDQWLLETGNKKRTELVLDRAVAHALREGWFDAPRLT